MNKRNLAIIVVIISSVIILATIVLLWRYNFVQNQKKLTSEEMSKVVSCNNLSSTGAPLFCIENLAMEYKKDAFCDQLWSSGNNNIFQGNVPFIKAHCLGMVKESLGFFGPIKRDANFCKKTSTMDLICKNQPANLQGECYNQLPDLKDGCLDGVAIANLDIDLCRQVQGTCIGWIAIRKADVNICKISSNHQLQNECFYRVAVTSKNSSYCNLIENDNFQKNVCITDVAIFSNNRIICNGLVKEGAKNEDAIYRIRTSICFEATVHSSMFQASSWLSQYPFDISPSVDRKNSTSVWEETFETGSDWNGNGSQILTDKSANAYVSIYAKANLDSYLWKQITIPKDALYMTYEIKNEKSAPLSVFSVMFGKDILSYYGSLAKIDDGFKKSSQIFLGDNAGKTDHLTFQLSRHLEESPTVFIDNIIFYK